jgi:hypothetical protein
LCPLEPKSSFSRKVIGHRQTHWDVIPANAGIHAQKDAVPYMFTMGPRLRGDDASASFEADFRLPVGFKLQLPDLGKKIEARTQSGRRPRARVAPG